MNDNSKTHIIIFDGICNLCNRFVNFVIKKDKKKQFYFTPLQSEIGIKYLKKFHLLESDINSIIYVQGEQFWIKSSAVLHIVKSLKRPWSCLYFFIFLPRAIRDKTYDLIAKNRYRWFGKKDTCRIPTPEERKRFL